MTGATNIDEVTKLAKQVDKTYATDGKGNFIIEIRKNLSDNHLKAIAKLVGELKRIEGPMKLNLLTPPLAQEDL